MTKFQTRCQYLRLTGVGVGWIRPASYNGVSFERIIITSGDELALLVIGHFVIRTCIDFATRWSQSKPTHRPNLVICEFRDVSC